MSCLTENSSVLLAIGTKLRPLLRTDFFGSDSGKLLGIVITASIDLVDLIDVVVDNLF